MTRRPGIRVLDDTVPAVEIVDDNGQAITILPATLDDDAGERLYEKLHELLTGVVVRRVRLTRIEVMDWEWDHLIVGRA